MSSQFALLDIQMAATLPLKMPGHTSKVAIIYPAAPFDDLRYPDGFFRSKNGHTYGLHEARYCKCRKCLTPLVLGTDQYAEVHP